MSDFEIKYLLPLLDDENREVYEAVKEIIMESGRVSIADLENALGLANTLLQHERIEFLIFKLKMQQTKNTLIEWVHSENKSLQEGWILLSSLQGNKISPVNVEKIVHQITRNIWLEINQKQTSLEKVAIFSRIFFELNGFRINQVEVTVIEDYYLDKILISKKGSLLSLNILYSIIARRLNLPLIPIKIQKKILLAYYDPVLSREAFIDIIHPFLFFIDLEQKGKIIGVREFDYLMKENQLSWNPDITLTNTHLLKNLLLRIKGVYTVLKDHEKVIVAEDLLKCFEL